MESRKETDFDIFEELDVEVVRCPVPFDDLFPPEVVMDEIDLHVVKEEQDSTLNLDVDPNTSYLFDEQFQIGANVEVLDSTSENSDLNVENEDLGYLRQRNEPDEAYVSVKTDLNTALSFCSQVKESKVMIAANGKWHEINHQGKLVPYFDQKGFQNELTLAEIDPNPKQEFLPSQQVCHFHFSFYM